jgi:hypothetical protein
VSAEANQEALARAIAHMNVELAASTPFDEAMAAAASLGSALARFENALDRLREHERGKQ